MKRALLTILLTTSAIAAEPPRLVVAGPSLTEAIVGLGLGDSLVGVDQSSLPLVGERKPASLGYHRLLSAEGVLSLRPTLVLVSDEAGPPPVIAQLRAVGVPVEVHPTPVDVEGARALVKKLGAALKRQQQAATLVAKLDVELAAAKSRIPTGRKAPRVLSVIARGSSATIGAGSGTAVDALIRLAGGANVLSSTTGFKPLNPEAVLQAAPDVVLIPRSSRSALEAGSASSALAGLWALPEARRPKIVELDDAAFFGIGAGAGRSVSTLVEALHGKTP